MRGPALRAGLVAVATVLSLAGCSPNEEDDFGPPSGIAQVDGRVFTADSLPANGGMVVSLTLCDLPVGGLAGQDHADSGGRFSIRGRLPPVGIMEFPAEADSVELACELIAGQTFARSGVVGVWFFRRGVEPTVLQVDLSEDRVP